MGNEIADYLWVMNEALIKGLKSAILVLEKVDEFSPENRQSILSIYKKCQNWQNL